MLKRSKLIEVGIFIAATLLAIVQVLLILPQTEGWRQIGGSISLNAFYNLQLFNGDANAFCSAAILTLTFISGSLTPIMLKNNNELSFIATRIGYQKFVNRGLKISFLSSLFLMLLVHLSTLAALNWGLAPLHFLTSRNSENIQIFGTRNDLLELATYILISSTGAGVFAMLVFSIGLYVKKIGLFVAVPLIAFLSSVLIVGLFPGTGRIPLLLKYTLFLQNLICPGSVLLTGSIGGYSILVNWLLEFVFWSCSVWLISRLWIRQQFEKD